MNKIQVSITVASTLEKAWRFWNDPKLIPLWAFASDDWECPHAENNLVVGGTFITTMSAKDKSFSFDFSGTYTDIIEYEKISYVMSKDINDPTARTCETIFDDLGDGTIKITETFDPENQNSAELQRNGWQSILNNFKKAVETTQEL
jgi:uncharacterized protein YndB with AHSA1/START domain